MNIESLLELLLKGDKTTNQNHPFRRFQIYTGRTWPKASLVYIKASSRAPRFQMNTRILLGIHIDFFLLKKYMHQIFYSFWRDDVHFISGQETFARACVPSLSMQMDGKVKMTFILPRGPKIHLDDTSSNQIWANKKIREN